MSFLVISKFENYVEFENIAIVLYRESHTHAREAI